MSHLIEKSKALLKVSPSSISAVFADVETTW
jgi:hypothetical protein